LSTSECETPRFFGDTKTFYTPCLYRADREAAKETKALISLVLTFSFVVLPLIEPTSEWDRATLRLIEYLMLNLFTSFDGL
jgi:hypothetical protein